MKKYIKELVFAILQLLLFYVYPAWAFRIDPMGAVFIMLFATLALSLVLGILSHNSVKWAYPAFCALLFFPTVPIYYNGSAMIHAMWYLVVALAGLALGSGMAALVRKLLKK